MFYSVIMESAMNNFQYLLSYLTYVFSWTCGTYHGAQNFTTIELITLRDVHSFNIECHSFQPGSNSARFKNYAGKRSGKLTRLASLGTRLTRRPLRCTDERLLAWTRFARPAASQLGGFLASSFTFDSHAVTLLTLTRHAVLG